MPVDELFNHFRRDQDVEADLSVDLQVENTLLCHEIFHGFLFIILESDNRKLLHMFTRNYTKIFNIDA